MDDNTHHPLHASQTSFVVEEEPEQHPHQVRTKTVQPFLLIFLLSLTCLTPLEAESLEVSKHREIVGHNKK
jgi:hypothetical protein